MKHLIGHTSPDTAFVVDDYPYGFRLRCKIRYWLEYRPRNGFRFMAQTSNPKKPGLVWNKPKASTYSPLAVMIQLDRNDKGIEEVKCLGLSPYGIEEGLEAYVEAHGVALQGENEQRIITGYRAAIKRTRERLAAQEGK